MPMMIGMNDTKTMLELVPPVTFPHLRRYRGWEGPDRGALPDRKPPRTLPRHWHVPWPAVETPALISGD